MGEKILKRATLCFPLRGEEVLLAKKTRHIGAGLWNGYGGGFEAGENVEHCAARELGQESGLVAKQLTPAAYVDFHNRTLEGVPFTCRVFVFLVEEFKGRERPSPEMATPQWFNKTQMPWDEMMPADPYWLPLVLQGERIYAEAWYGPKQKRLEKPVDVNYMRSCDLARLFQ